MDLHVDIRRDFPHWLSINIVMTKSLPCSLYHFILILITEIDHRRQMLVQISSSPSHWRTTIPREIRYLVEIFTYEAISIFCTLISICNLQKTRCLNRRFLQQQTVVDKNMLEKYGSYLWITVCQIGGLILISFVLIMSVTFDFHAFAILFTVEKFNLILSMLNHVS